MINMISSQLKEDRKFGRLNKFLVKQWLAIIGLLAIGFMLSGLDIIGQDEDRIVQTIEAKKAKLEPLKTYEVQAKELNDNVATLDKLFTKEIKFSTLIRDVASAIPNGARLTGLTLTGEADSPLQISAELTNQSLAGVMRASLVESGIFSSADIINIQPENIDESGNATPATASFSATLTNDNPDPKASKTPTTAKPGGAQ